MASCEWCHSELGEAGCPACGADPLAGRCDIMTHLRLLVLRRRVRAGEVSEETAPLTRLAFEPTAKPWNSEWDKPTVMLVLGAV